MHSTIVLPAFKAAQLKLFSNAVIELIHIADELQLTVSLEESNEVLLVNTIKCARMKLEKDSFGTGVWNSLGSWRYSFANSTRGILGEWLTIILNHKSHTISTYMQLVPSDQDWQKAGIDAFLQDTDGEYIIHSVQIKACVLNKDEIQIPLKEWYNMNTQPYTFDILMMVDLWELQGFAITTQALFNTLNTQYSNEYNNYLNSNDRIISIPTHILKHMCRVNSSCSTLNLLNDIKMHYELQASIIPFLKSIKTR